MTGTEKLLLEIRKIVREEISIAMEEPIKTIKNITESIRVSKSNNNVIPTTKKENALIESVKKSINNGSINKIDKPVIRANETLKKQLNSLPVSLREAMAATVHDIQTGKQKSIGASDISHGSIIDTLKESIDRDESTINDAYDIDDTDTDENLYSDNSTKKSLYDVFTRDYSEVIEKAAALTLAKNGR